MENTENTTDNTKTPPSLRDRLLLALCVIVACIGLVVAVNNWRDQLANSISARMWTHADGVHKKLDVLLEKIDVLPANWRK